MTQTSSFKFRQLKNCKCFKVRRASRLTTQLYDRKLKPLGLKITQFSILSFIATSGKKNLVALADELFMDRTTLTRGLNILMKRKLIRNINNKDLRKRVVVLTNDGEEILEKAIPLWLEAEEEVFDESKKNNFSVI